MSSPAVRLRSRSLLRRMLDAGANFFEGKRVTGVRSAGIAHRNADLADAIKARDDQGAVPIMERLIPADK